MIQSVSRAAVAALALVAAAGLAACGTTKVKDTEVAEKVKSEVLQPRGITNATVRCPKETEAKKDAAIKCTVSSGKERGSVTATVLDDDGKLGRYQSDVDKLQLAVIERNASREGASKGVVGTVDCPDSSKPRAGATLFCVGRIRGASFGVVIVRQTDAASNVDVTVQRRRLRTAQIERNISRAVRRQGINANVNCPDRVVAQRGSTFECTVRNPANGRQLTIVATQTDEIGNFRLRVK